MALTTNYRGGTGTAAAQLANFSTNILVEEWIDMRFIEVLRERLVFLPLGRPTDFPSQNGINVHWNLFNNPLPDTTALATEGDDPSDTNDLTVTAITDSLQEFTSGYKFTKVLKLTSINGTLEQMTQGLSHKAALSIDKMVQVGEAGDAGTGGLAAVSASAKLDAGAAMTVDQLRIGALKLFANNAQGHPNSPGGNMFIFVGSVEAIYDMLGEGSPAWFQIKDEGLQNVLTQPPPIQNGTIQAGAYNCILKMSTNIQRNTATSPDDDLNYLLADSAFGVISLDSDIMDPRIIMTPPEMNTSAPARNRGTAAYWFLFAAKLLDEKRVFQIASDATGIGV